MISVFLREQKRYTQEELVKEFHCSEEKTVCILKRLKEYGVLKAVKANVCLEKRRILWVAKRRSGSRCG